MEGVFGTLKARPAGRWLFVSLVVPTYAEGVDRWWWDLPCPGMHGNDEPLRCQLLTNETIIAPISVRFVRRVFVRILASI
eukprot:2903293-Amphidinium_carterae.1